MLVRKRPASGESVDRVGMVASTACAAHCALGAALPSLLGAFGLGALLSPEAEWALTLIAVALALIAVRAGYRRHRVRHVGALLFVGVIGLVLARGIEGAGGHHESDGEHHHASEHAPLHLVGTVVGVAAGLLLVLGHVLNARATRCCRDE